MAAEAIKTFSTNKPGIPGIKMKQQFFFFIELEMGAFCTPSNQMDTASMFIILTQHAFKQSCSVQINLHFDAKFDAERQ